MNIADLLHAIRPIEIQGNPEVEIQDVTDDSRQIRPGSLFVAVKGVQMDGHKFLAQAWDRGAAGIVVQEPVPDDLMRRGVVVQVENTRWALGCLASQFHKQPSHHLKMIGVTGTNGKTTVTHLIRALLEGAGRKSGVVGTVGYFIGGRMVPASHTTPGAVALQGYSRTWWNLVSTQRSWKCRHTALALDRVAGCEFDVAVFTNLTQDHLDFHADMEDYFRAKQRLFDGLSAMSSKSGAKRAVINTDDEWGKRLCQSCSVPVWTYGAHQPADIQARDIACTVNGTSFRVVTPHGVAAVESPLAGEHNVYNMLAAIGVGLELGVTLPSLASSLRSVKNVPGRFERIEGGQDFTVVVDYAHTEDALLRLLLAAKALKKNRIITVFGCGGDRDVGKRPKMGQVAVSHSDLAILTSDNPRTEEPLSILQDIERGILDLPVAKRSEYRMIPDRREAIGFAITAAETDDLVLIAGKGHEDYQIVGTKRLDFDDRQVASEALAQRSQSVPVRPRDR